MTEATKTTATIHPWERAGLGIAPFKLIGYEKSLFQACPGAPVKAGSSCDYCATGIADVFWIQSADGRRFKVGSDCVGRVNAKGTKVRDAVDRKIAQLKKAAQLARIADLRTTLDRPEIRDRLAALPGPKFGTLLDWADWMMKNAGATGKIKVARAVAKATGEDC